MKDGTFEKAILEVIEKKHNINPNMTIQELVNKFPSSVRIDNKQTSTKYEFIIYTDTGTISIKIDKKKCQNNKKLEQE